MVRLTATCAVRGDVQVLELLNTHKDKLAHLITLGHAQGVYDAQGEVARDRHR
ncbi:MAG: hypothetical protein IPF65_13560 [Polaromonas sp.]|nr:hypothetical protein [Polaromonas sp.]